MPRADSSAQNEYGGDWTIRKLDNLGAYADAYTTALKNQPFKLIYLDAFAGEGTVAIKSGEFAGEVIDGSARVALDIRAKPFDELVFVEKDAAVASRLKTFLNENARGRNTRVLVDDANTAVPQFCERLDGYDRALVLLDPFATEVAWSTVQALADSEKCDVLILFPTMAVRRMMARYEDPETAQFKERFTKIYGGEGWMSLYRQREQPSLFPDDPTNESPQGVDKLVAIYLDRLEEAFKACVSQSLTNRTNSAMFEFIVACGDRKGAPIARRIANAIVKKA